MKGRASLIFNALGYLRRHRALAAAFMLLTLLSGVFEGVGLTMVVPAVQGFISGSFDVAGQSAFLRVVMERLFSIFPDISLRPLMMAIFLLILLKNVCLLAGAFISRWLQYKTRWEVVTDVFKQVLDLEYGYIASKRSGEIYSWLDLESARATHVLYAVLQLITAFTVVCLYSFLMFMLSWQVTLIVAIPLIILSFSMSKINNILRSIGQKVSASGRDIFSYWVEILAALRTVRLFGNYEHEVMRHEERWKRFHKLAMARYLILDFITPGSETLLMLILISAMIFGASAIISKGPQIFPVLLVFVYILKLLQQQVTKINKLRAELASDLPAVEVISNVLRRDDKPYIRGGKVRFSGLKTGIKFENISFKYPSNQEHALQDLAFCIPKGRTTALVGSSGAGKSTLVDLVFRLYDPQQGQILIDGENLKNLNLEDWQSRIGFVSQDTFVFNASVWENIAYGKLNASKDEITRAAKKANAHEFILDLPMGYDTLLGDRGIKLSGGQRQRVAIARAVLKMPDILIFDEATSSLDTESERLVQKAIYEISRNSTVLVIAHRLSTVEAADQLIVLENGRIVETGTHKQLLSNKARYAQLHYLQYKNIYEKIN